MSEDDGRAEFDRRYGVQHDSGTGYGTDYGQTYAEPQYEPHQVPQQYYADQHYGERVDEGYGQGYDEQYATQEYDGVHRFRRPVRLRPAVHRQERSAVNRTTMSLIGAATALAGVTGVAAVAAPGEDDGAPARRARKPVERSSLVCPAAERLRRGADGVHVLHPQGR